MQTFSFLITLFKGGQMPEAKPILKKDVPEFDKVNDSTYKLSYNKNAEVEIGNISEEDFHPHAKIKRWKEPGTHSAFRLCL